MSVPSVSIQNKKGVSMLIDEEDLGLLTQHKDGYWCFFADPKSYVLFVHKKCLGGDGCTVPFHRIIMNVSVGSDAYHINRDRLDNRKENLRIGTHGQHLFKPVGYKTSRFRGVSRNGKSWRATIRRDYVVTHLGNFTTELEAALAYDAAAKLQDCDLHFLNFPDEAPNA